MPMARFVCLCALWLSLAGLAGCSEDKSGPVDEAELPANVVKEVGKEGGTLKAKGLTLEIPEGALDEKTSISVTNRGKTAPGSLSKEQVSDLFEFGPEGTTFKKDVRVTFEAESSEKELAVFFTKQGSSEFEKLSTEVEGDEVSAKTRHFSQGFVGVPLDAVAELDGGVGLDDGGAVSDGAISGDQDGGITADGSVVAPAHIVVTSHDQFGLQVNQTWAAFQDGDGPWQLLEPTAETGVYEFVVTGSRYGVAFVCSDAELIDSAGTIHYEPATTTALDVITTGEACTAGAEPFYPYISGTVQFAPNTSSLRIGHARRTGYPYNSPVNYIEGFVENETNDLLFAVGPSDELITQMLFQHDLTLTDNVTGNNVDMSNAVGVFSSGSAEVLNASEFTNVEVRYTTRGTTDGLWLNSGAITGTSTRTTSYALVPGELARPGDHYVVIANEPGNASVRRATLSSPDGGDLSVALPDAFAVTFGSTDAPYTRPSYGFAALSGATKYTFESNYVGSRSFSHQFAITVNPAWLQGTTQELVFPDFSQVTGFELAWVPPSPLTDVDVQLNAEVRVESTANGAAVVKESGVSGAILAPGLAQ